MANILAFLALGIATVFHHQPEPATSNNEEIRWLTWDEAMTLSQTQPRKIFIDIYTDWCGFCKRMDATTFVNPEIVQYLNEHFYAIKFNAEMRDEIVFNDHTFKWVDTGRNGIHTLAYSLLEGKMSYPSFVMMDEAFDRIAIMPGYKPADQLMKELRFAAEEVYKTRSWDEYRVNE